MFKPGSIRFFLACVVVLFHITKFIPLGGFAVDCFFVMSGYWISLMYEHKYLKTDNKFKVFYISRVWRLWPAFYFFTLCAVFVNYAFDTKLWHNLHTLSTPDFIMFWVSNLTFLTYNLSKFRLLGTAWSLDVEMQFYILFPIIFYIFNNKKMAQLGAAVFFLALSIILEIYFSDTILSKSVFTYLYLFLFGMVIYQNKLKFSPKIEKAGLGLFVILFVAQTVVPGLRKIGLDTYSAMYILVLSKLQLLLVFPALTNSVYNKSDKRDRILGDLSYIVYIAHWVWIVPYNLYIVHISNKMLRIPYALGFILVTVITSYIVYKLFDRPIEKLRHAWVNSHINSKKNAAELNVNEVLTTNNK